MFGRGDIEGALSFVSPDVEASPASALLSGVPGHYSGHEGLRRWWREGQVKGVRVTYSLLEVRAIDDERVFVELGVSTQRGDSPGMGTLVVTICHVRDGRVSKVDSYIDPDKGRAAAGRPL